MTVRFYNKLDTVGERTSPKGMGQIPNYRKKDEAHSPCFSSLSHVQARTDGSSLKSLICTS